MHICLLLCIIIINIYIYICLCTHIYIYIYICICNDVSILALPWTSSVVRAVSKCLHLKPPGLRSLAGQSRVLLAQYYYHMLSRKPDYYYHYYHYHHMLVPLLPHVSTIARSGMERAKGQTQVLEAEARQLICHRAFKPHRVEGPKRKKGIDPSNIQFH